MPIYEAIKKLTIMTPNSTIGLLNFRNSANGRQTEYKRAYITMQGAEKREAESHEVQIFTNKPIFHINMFSATILQNYQRII